MIRVILESPFAGNVEGNIEYARMCLRDCLLRGEAPIASHLLYTQPGVLDDTNPEERKLGIEAGLLWGALAEKTVVYIDRGISRGMQYGIERAQKEGRPVEYRTLHPIRIVTITGPSGVGKTSVAKKLLELKSGSRLVISLTTRNSRTSDLPGEYRCNVAPEDFSASEKFLWVVQAHGNTYGTLKSSVDEALALNQLSLMLLVPEAIKILREYADAQDKRNALSFYILSPSERELRRRMEARGENAEFVAKRIADCKKWDGEAKRSNIPYIFLSNEEPEVGIEKAAREILKYFGAD